MSLAESRPAAWRNIGVFFSSTFRDMHAERDILRSGAFLELEQRLRPRRHYLNVIDLRAGVETAHVDDEATCELQVLRVCLDEVKRSRPFLIGLLGDRYGWVPPEEDARAAVGSDEFQPAIEGRSVTELELLAGLVETPGQDRRFRIYIRVLDKRNMPNAVRAIYDDRYATDSGAKARCSRLDALKNRLRAEYPDRVRTYTAQWDAAARCVTGLNGLAAMVLEDLGNDLDAVTSAHEALAPKTWQEADAGALRDYVDDRLRHLVERPSIIAPIIRRIGLSARPSDTWGVCFTGESGMGKSTLFASLFRELAPIGSAGQFVLLSHAAGAFSGSDQINRMLRRWVSELAVILGVEDPLETWERAPTHAATSPASSEIDEEFAKILSKAGKRIPVVILVDALDQFETTTRGRSLTWLPRDWPHHVRFIATSTSGVQTGALTRHGIPVEIVSLPRFTKAEARILAERVFRERFHRDPNAAVLTVLLNKVDSEDTTRFAHGNPLWLELALQESSFLEGDDYARADEEFGTLAESDRLGPFLIAEAQRLPSTLSGVYDKLLDRSGRNVGVTFTRAVMSLIVLSRAGWREADLKATVSSAAAESGTDWSDLAFAGLRRILGHHLTQRGTEGRWDVGHTSLRTAILRRHLSHPNERRRLHGILAEHLQSLPSGDQLRETETMVHFVGLAEPAAAAAWIARIQPLQWTNDRAKADLTGSMRALVWAIDATQDKSERERLLAWIGGLIVLDKEHLDRTDAVANALVFDLDEALAVSGEHGADRGFLLERLQDILPHVYLADHSLQTARTLAVLDSKLGDFYLRRSHTGDLERAHTCYRHTLDSMQVFYEGNPTGDLEMQDLAMILGQLGAFYSRRHAAGDPALALECFQRATALIKELWVARPGDQATARALQVTLGRLGEFYVERNDEGDIARARELYAQEAKIAQDVYAAHPLDSRALADLAVSHERLGDLRFREGGPEGMTNALAHAEDALRITRAAFQADPQDTAKERAFGISLYKTGVLHSERRESDDLRNALALLQESLEITQRLSERNPADARAARELAVTLDHLGDVFLSREELGDASRALEFYLHSLRIRETIHHASPADGLVSRDLSVTLNKVGDALYRLDRPEDFPRIFEVYHRSLAIAKRLYEANPDDRTAGRDLGATHERLARLHLRRNESDDRALVLESYLAALRIDQRLFEVNPGDRYGTEELERSYERLAKLYCERSEPGDIEQAMAAYNGLLKTAQAFHEATDGSREAIRRLGFAHSSLALFHNQQRQPSQALQQFSLSASLLEKLPDDLAAQDALKPIQMAIKQLEAILRRPGPIDPATPYSQANAARAAELNLEYQQALATWQALPLWRRLRTKRPQPPPGI